MLVAGTIQRLFGGMSLKLKGPELVNDGRNKKKKKSNNI